ncbi:MAG TPA: glycosyltransferase family 2 protein [Chitinophagaceae bacterium]|nr:glycosyltransferase family 2 protein [Chitinophagaceae bacterium]
MSEEQNILSSINDSNLPLVSVGVPTYNRPFGLKKCLEHLILQTYQNIEIIISDNCSTNPEVQKIIQYYSAKDGRIKHFRQTENIGLEKNFNFLYAQSFAPYFMWMSDDDYFDVDYVEKCVFFLEQNPDYVLCSGTAKYYSGNDFLFVEKMFAVNQKTAFKRLLQYFSKVGKNGNFYGVFRRSLITENPLSLHIGCDWSFMARLAVHGKLTFLETTSYQRSSEGHSASRRAMIRKFKFNRFQSIFFETYSAYVISSNIFNDAAVNKKINYLQRKLIVILIFFQINYKYFIHFFKRRIWQK